MGRNKYGTGKANGTASEEKENFPKGIRIQIRGKSRIVETFLADRRDLVAVFYKACNSSWSGGRAGSFI